jgi:hypothetical protein
MKVIFFMPSPAALRHVESTLMALTSRGHLVHLAFDTMKGGEGLSSLRQLWSAQARLTYGRSPDASMDSWSRVRRSLRLTVDYLRSLDAQRLEAPAFQRLAARRAPRVVRILGQRLPSGAPLVRHPLLRIIAQLERAAPPCPLVHEHLRHHAPDVIVLTGVRHFVSSQNDYVLGARQLGIPTGLCVTGWDDLLSNGLLRRTPALLAVWNHHQAAQAVDLHGVPPQNVTVTGLPGFDSSFKHRSRRSREELSRVAGIDLTQPYILYVGAPHSIAPDEAGVLRDWLSKLWSLGSETLQRAPVIVYPMDGCADSSSWRPPGLVKTAAIWPVAADDAVGTRHLSHFYDLIFHSSVVVTVNPDAIVDSIIAGRPVQLLPRSHVPHRPAQLDQMAFAGLHEHGMLQTPDTVERQVHDLELHLRHASEYRCKGRDSFLLKAIRPQGLDREASKLLADAIERLAEVTVPSEYRAPAVASSAVKAMEKLFRARQMIQTTKAGVRHGLARDHRGRRNEVSREVKRWDPPAVRPVSELTIPPAMVLPDVILRSLNPGGQGTRPGAHAILEQAAASDLPILVGPWLGEVGFELMYWIPFLTRMFGLHQSLRERVTIVSRGGTASWYRNIADKYFDIYDVIQPDDLLLRLEGNASDKPEEFSDLDKDLIESIKTSIGLPRVMILHTREMFEIYRNAVLTDIRALHSALEFRRFPQIIDDEIGFQLPEEFAAVRFYSNRSFPDVHENRNFVGELLAWLSDIIPVVLINPGRRFDDHWDFVVKNNDRIIQFDRATNPRDNLDVQTKIINRAKISVGTYGGLSYLPPFYGLPSVSFFSDASLFYRHHLDLAVSTFGGGTFGPYAVFATTDRERSLETISRYLGRHGLLPK